MLGTVRAYARTRLQQQDDLETRRIALADHLLARARAWAGQLNGPEGAAVVGRYDDTAADLDAVLDWALATGRTGLAVELATTITDLWIASGRLTDGLRRTQRLLELRGLSRGSRQTCTSPPESWPITSPTGMWRPRSCAPCSRSPISALPPRPRPAVISAPRLS